jgi:hypothetical protein
VKREEKGGKRTMTSSQGECDSQLESVGNIHVTKQISVLMSITHQYTHSMIPLHRGRGRAHGLIDRSYLAGSSGSKHEH